MRNFKSLLPGLLVTLAAIALCSSSLFAQQTLGGITGEVTDTSGGVIPNASVTVVNEQTSLTRTTQTNDTGVYTFVNLPIGISTLTYKAAGYEVQKTPHITVQADRTATVNAGLKVGAASTTIEVEAAPLMNAVDTTNGYVMETSDFRNASAHGQLHRPGHSVPRSQRRTPWRHGRKLRPGQCTHLGQRPARHVECFPAERRGRQQPV
jgi:hypothetical protein